MPEARDRLMRTNDGVTEMYNRRRTSIGRVGILPDNDDIGRSINLTPFRWGATPLTGSRSGQQISESLTSRTTTRGGVSGRSIFETPTPAYRRGGRSENTPSFPNSSRRGRGGRPGPRSVLPFWYPRTPLSDITHIVRAIERRGRFGDDGGQILGTSTPIRIYEDPSPFDPYDAQLEHDACFVTPKPKLASKTFKRSALGSVPLILTAIVNQCEAKSELQTPQKKLLNSIEIVQKVVMEELHRLQRTPAAKKAKRERIVRNLMSMR
ncbi:hypothetical protein SSX86_026551 [Deinandra increscens subsp. villosa]|uniref:Protein POLYCHOME n=1 Tax=Deinandra increscens subsp. villosa TaxID=3103831 RepID=A0AAP0GMB4_9ASTR